MKLATILALGVSALSFWVFVVNAPERTLCRQNYVIIDHFNIQPSGKCY